MSRWTSLPIAGNVESSSPAIRSRVDLLACLLVGNDDRSGWASLGGFEDCLVAAFAGDDCDVLDREDFGCCERAVAVGGARELVDVGNQGHAAFLSWLLVLGASRIRWRSSGSARGRPT